MSDTKTPDEPIVVNEEADGSVVVDLPESIPSPEITDADDAAAERAEIAATGRVDPQAEAEREARRAKRRARKEYHKTVAHEKDAKLQNLERQNRELLERLSVVEKKTLAADLGRMDARIEEEQNRLNFAKLKLKEAAETGNGDLLVSAQDMMLEASKNLDSMRNVRDRAAKPQRQAQPTQQIDPRVQQLAAQWMANNSWYDPHGQDADSRRALTEDQILVDEGYDPATEEYWEEFNRRLQNTIPHRYTGGAVRENNTSRPRTVVTGSSRQTTGGTNSGNQFMLSRDQVQAMKDAGMWDNVEKRNRMIKRYAQEARNNGYRS